jgi:hypothetical protein
MLNPDQVRQLVIMVLRKLYNRLQLLDIPDLLGKRLSEFNLVFLPYLLVQIVHLLLLLLFLFVLPDHLVPEWIVVGFLVHLVMQDFSFVVCDYDLVGLVLILEVLLEVRVRLWLVF